MIDLFLPPLDDHSYGLFKRAVSVEMAPGPKVRCQSAEDVVISKLRWFDLGNRVSDRQWNDIVLVLELRKDLLDLEYVRRWTGDFGLRDLFDDALSQVIGLATRKILCV